MSTVAITPFRSFCALGTEFVHSVVLGRKSDLYYEQYILTQAEPSSLTPIPFGHDFVIFVYTALLCFAINWGLRLLIVEPWASHLLKSHLGKSPNKATVQKFAQASLEALFYGTFFFFSCRIYLKQPFAWPSSKWWVDIDQTLPGHVETRHHYLAPDYKFFYLLYGGRYAAGLASVMLEHKRKDFVEMVAHHLVTMSLVLCSFNVGYTRVGGAIMLLMDIADPPLHIAKQFKYLAKTKDSNPQWWADRFFEVFGVSFIFTRNIMYPYVVWAAIWEFKQYSTHDFDTHILCALLIVLLLLQFYWSGLLVLAIIHMMKEGGVDDIRSDDEDNSNSSSSSSRAKDDGRPPAARKKGGGTSSSSSLSPSSSSSSVLASTTTTVPPPVVTSSGSSHAEQTVSPTRRGRSTSPAVHRKGGTQREGTTSPAASSAARSKKNK